MAVDVIFHPIFVANGLQITHLAAELGYASHSISNVAC